jgi:hypothetical protein
MMPVPHVILVDTAYADTLTQDVRSLPWMATKRLDSHEMVGTGIIFVPAVHAQHITYVCNSLASFETLSRSTQLSPCSTLRLIVLLTMARATDIDNLNGGEARADIR